MNTNHRVVVSVPADLYDRVNRLLAIESLDGMTDQQLLDAGANTDQSEGILYVEFDDGSHLNYDLCSGQSNYYDDVVWSSPDGRRDVTLDCEYSLNDIEFQIDDDTYFVEVVRGKENAVHSYDHEGESETVAQTRDGKFKNLLALSRKRITHIRFALAMASRSATHAAYTRSWRQNRGVRQQIAFIRKVGEHARIFCKH